MKYPLFALLIALLIAFGVYKCAPGAPATRAPQAQTRLIRAVMDTLRHSRDQFDRLVAEKRVIESDLAFVQTQYAILSENQRQLVAEIEGLNLEKRQNLASATRIQQIVRVQVRDTVLMPQPGADLAWKHDSDTLSYDIRVRDSVLTIKDLRIPNGLIVSTFRDKKQDLHVQVTNTNPAYQTQDVDTIVPEKARKRPWVGKILTFLAGALVGGLVAHR